MINLLNKKWNKKNNKKGFTLIELIIVIAILAILAAILVPSMIGYINDATDSVATTNARTVYSASAAAYATNAAGNTTIASIAGMSVEDLMISNVAFQKKTGELLGPTFEGYVWITIKPVNGKNAIVSTGWSSDSTTKPDGEYIVGESD